MDRLNYWCSPCNKMYVLHGDIENANSFETCEVCGHEKAKLMGMRIGGYVKVWNYDVATQSAEDNKHMCGMPD